MGVWIETILVIAGDRLNTSHPSWVCGLKQERLQKYHCVEESHPSWVCGLKHERLWVLSEQPSSHPSWVCGLKLGNSTEIWQSHGHTLRGCVDWNIIRSFKNAAIWVSHPSWVCGLKLCKNDILVNLGWSHPSWVCGLKQYSDSDLKESHQSHPSWVCGLKLSVEVAYGYELASHPSWVCGLKPSRNNSLQLSGKCHTLRGCVDWNMSW